MKRKCLPLALALSMFMSNAMPVYAQDSQWLKGWTGKADSTNYTIDQSGDKVVMTNDKVNNGKFTDGEDSIIYYAQKISGEEDFTFSATVSIDEYSVMEESSNPQQGSVGIAILDDTFNKTDDVTFTDSLFLGTWAADKKSDLAFYHITRDNSSVKTVGEQLSDTFANAGTDLGTFDLSITKSGNLYTLTCGDKSTSGEVYSFEGDIYPCLYIARNAKATFSNVSLKIAEKRPVEIKLENPVTEYFYGQKLEPVKASVTYSDGSVQQTEDLIVKGYKPEKTGKQKLVVSAGAAKCEYYVTVKPRVTEKLDVTYKPVKTNYAKNGVFSTQGIEVVAQYNDGSKEVLDENSYTIKVATKKIKNGEQLSCGAGKQPVVVTRNNGNGYDGGKASARFDINVVEKTVEQLIVEKPAKTTYYINDAADYAGMKVTAVYSDGTKELLNKNEYVVDGFTTDWAGDVKLSVSPVSGGAKAEFNITVKERTAQKLVVTKYPRTTYSLGDEIDTELVASIEYDNGEIEKTDAYTVDTSAVNTSAVGEYTIYVKPDNAKLETVSIKVNVAEEKPHFWRKAVFGQSSGYKKTESTGVQADNYGTVDGKINVRSWDGTGKITNDHDGISYYYTTVNPDEDFTLSADIKVNKYLEHNNDDTKRNGQEAFGIMVRDVVPLTAADGTQTIDESLAQKDEDGVAIAMEGDKVFASNMAILGGYSGTGWPSGESDPSYDKKININRINLLVRNGVTATDGGGTRIGPEALSSKFPAEGNKYRLTLQRLNGGIYAKCYDYQTEETKDTFFYDESFLTAQSKQAYIGFFTARWADIEVSDVSYYTGSKSYSQTITPINENVKTAEIEVESSKYSTNANYNLSLSATDSVGKVTVKLNDSIIAENVDIKDTISIPAKLRRDAENRFTIVYTPDDTQKLTSTEPIVLRHTVYQKDMDSTQKVIYVSPEGSFKGTGTKESPLDIDSAVGFVEAGQKIVLEEGTYKRTKPIEIERGNDGKAGAYKSIIGEGKVVFDYMGQSAGAVFVGNYWNISGIEFKNCGPNLKCVHLAGSYCVIENCKFHDNQDMGLQISRVGGSDDRRTWPAYNQIINCESYNNCDPSKINADGFGAKLTVGEGNVFKGCVSHHNVDDGWDLYTKVGTGAIGAVTLEDCISYKNGTKLNADGTEESYNAGGNNGFKLGGENVGVPHKLINCVAYANGNNGITTNSNPMLIIDGVKCSDNEGANIRLYSDKPQEYNYSVKNAVSFNGGEPDILGTVNEDTEYKNNNTNPILNITNYFDLDGKGSVNSLGEKATEDMVK